MQLQGCSESFQVGCHLSKRHQMSTHFRVAGYHIAVFVKRFINTAEIQNYFRQFLPFLTLSVNYFNLNRAHTIYTTAWLPVLVFIFSSDTDRKQHILKYVVVPGQLNSFSPDFQPNTNAGKQIEPPSLIFYTRTHLKLVRKHAVQVKQQSETRVLYCHLLLHFVSRRCTVAVQKVIPQCDTTTIAGRGHIHPKLNYSLSQLNTVTISLPHIKIKSKK